ncbi:MAG: dihydropteroate synthase [bacterium]|nr:dihydropteroate synthase [bacterium]
MTIRTAKRTESATKGICLSDGRVLSLAKPLVMGILNITPDSFSDGGRFNSIDRALEQALLMVSEGADLIDVGGESSRPGADPVPLEVELERVIPLVESIRAKSDIPISIDTYKAEVAGAALKAGADIINDISAMRFDPGMVTLVQATVVPVILMHMLGKPKDMQQNPVYTDCVGEIAEFFRERIEFCQSSGIEPDRLIIDPGIGFGKRLHDNLAILSGIDQLARTGLPILIGASRKSFIGQLTPGGGNASERLGGSIAAATVAILGGADIIRVHDVRETVEAISLINALKETK